MSNGTKGYAKAKGKAADQAVKGIVDAGQEALSLYRACKSGPERKYAVRILCDSVLEQGIPCTETVVVDDMRAALLADRFPKVLELRSTELLRPLIPLLKLDVESGDVTLDVVKGVSQTDVELVIMSAVDRTTPKGEFECSPLVRTTNRELRDKLITKVRAMRGLAPIAKKGKSTNAEVAKAVEARVGAPSDAAAPKPVDADGILAAFKAIPDADKVDVVLNMLGSMDADLVRQVRELMEESQADVNDYPGKTPCCHDTALEPVAA